MLPTPTSVRNYLRHVAGWVWTEQDEALHYGLKLQEETITEILLLRMARECHSWGLHIKMFNRIEEGGSSSLGKVGNGADWEWYFQTPHCGVGFRVQAKVLSSGLTPRRKALSRGIYGGLEKDGEQAKKLIIAARKGGYNPIYIFYNHPWVSDRKIFSTMTSSPTPARTDWGCSVATAKFVQDQADNRLSILAKGMMPWHLFFSMEPGCGARKAIEKLGGGQDFIPQTPRPAWLEMLDDQPEGEASETEADLNSYLVERGLAGVAYFEVAED